MPRLISGKGSLTAALPPLPSSRGMALFSASMDIDNRGIAACAASVAEIGSARVLISPPGVEIQRRETLTVDMSHPRRDALDHRVIRQGYQQGVIP